MIACIQSCAVIFDCVTFSDCIYFNYLTKQLFEYYVYCLFIAWQDVITEHRTELLTTLPMNDAIFVARLEENNFFSGDQKSVMQSKQTQAEKADYFLDSIVKNNEDIVFPTLLDVMKNFGAKTKLLVYKMKFGKG